MIKPAPGLPALLVPVPGGAELVVAIEPLDGQDTLRVPLTPSAVALLARESAAILCDHVQRTAVRDAAEKRRKSHDRTAQPVDIIDI